MWPGHFINRKSNLICLLHEYMQDIFFVLRIQIFNRTNPLLLSYFLFENWELFFKFCVLYNCIRLIFSGPFFRSSDIYTLDFNSLPSTSINLQFIVLIFLSYCFTFQWRFSNLSSVLLIKCSTVPILFLKASNTIYILPWNFWHCLSNSVSSLFCHCLDQLH